MPTPTPGMRDLCGDRIGRVRELALLAGPLIWSSHYRAKPAHYRARSRDGGSAATSERLTASGRTHAHQTPADISRPMTARREDTVGIGRALPNRLTLA